MAKKKSGGVTITMGGKKKTLAELKSKGPKGHISNKNKKEKRKSNKPQQKGRPVSHGMSNTPTYGSWRNARQRCTNENHPQYKDYGGRDIKCELSFEDFFEIMGERPEGQTLDRIDPEGNYEPGNIRWASRKTQADNRRTSNPYREQAKERIRERSRMWYQTAQEWNACVRYMNAPEKNEILDDLKNERGLPKISWEWGDPRDFADGLIDRMTLPSLTVPDTAVAFACYPFHRSGHDEADRRGIIGGLMNVPLKGNATKKEMTEFTSYWGKQKKYSGLCLTGAFYNELGGKRYPERFLMALAAHLLNNKTDARFAPMTDIAEALEDEKTDADYESKILWSPLLIIPDFHTDVDKGFGIKPWLQTELYGWLRHRVRLEGYQTIIFAHDRYSFGEDVAGIIDTSFHVP